MLLWVWAFLPLTIGCLKKERKMNRKTILWVAFIVVALVQLYVPAQMIWESEGVIAAGTAYKFNTAPVDPKDPFRGKYITLNYSDNSIKIENADDWQNGEPIQELVESKQSKHEEN